MKTFAADLLAAFSGSQMRRNLWALLKVVGLLGLMLFVFAVAFHYIMLHVEGREYSWVTSVYWTLTVMSTLGFGDITFHSDIGRAFSVVVLLSGVVMLLIVLPFAFIRYFYAPWLEAQTKLRVARTVPPEVGGHVLFAGYDSVAADLVPYLRQLDVPYYVIEPNPALAAELHGEGVSVVAREMDSRATYEDVGVARAALVFANRDDPTNTNITLTVRELDLKVPVAALAEHEDSVDILELAGASAVLPLKQRLGEHLAGRANAGQLRTFPVGRYRDLIIAEFPVHRTGLAGRTIRDTRLRELTGLNVVAVWERGTLRPARPDTVMSDYAVPVVVGTEEQMTTLDAMFAIYAPNDNPVIVVGGGLVGRAAARSLKARGVSVHLVERNPRLAKALDGAADRVIIGDASDREVLMDAGLAAAPSVALTTNDDAMNVFLAVYCRKLNPDLRIVSRITHDRNLEAIHRAGADFVLSYSSLGARTLLGLLRRQELTMLGEGVDLFVIETPEVLAGKTLAQSAIGQRTGLNVIAVKTKDGVVTSPTAATRLAAREEIVAIGSPEQRDAFREAFGS